MILLAGETEYQDKVKDFLRRSGYAEETVATGLIARAMNTTTKADLHRWLLEHQAITVDIEDLMNKSITAYSELPARIKTIDRNTGGNWYMHDFRPLWFWEQFLTLGAAEVQVLALVSEFDENDYYMAIKNFFARRLPKDAKTITKRPTQSEFKALIDLKPRAIKK